MRKINPISHLSLLHAELTKFFPADSVASRLKGSLGTELGTWFADDDFISNEESYEYFPVRVLFEFLMSGNGIKPSDLKNIDGNLYDDDSRIISNYSSSEFSKAEHLAAFGLWFINSEAKSMGGAPFDNNGTNIQGWFELDVLHHKAECLLNAYQSLWYANRFTQKIELTSDEKVSIAKFDFSAIGRSGAEKRHSEMASLRKWTIEKYAAEVLDKKWPSANAAAHAIKDDVIAYGKTIGRNATLTPSNAQRTIAAWINEYLKSV